MKRSPHLRADGKPKVMRDRATAERIAAKTGAAIYQCPECGFWHNGGKGPEWHKMQKKMRKGGGSSQHVRGRDRRASAPTAELDT